MFKEISWKKVNIGAFIIILLTTFIQKVLFNVKLIPTNNIAIDFISWIIIYLIIAIITLIITHISQNIKGLYRVFIYVVATIIILLFTFVIAFSYKAQKVNEYRAVLSLMIETNTSEITALINEKENFIFLLTSEDCPYCIEFLPTISEKVSENTTLPIYYVNRKSDTNSTLKESLEVETIPFLVKMEHGEIIQNYFDNPLDFFE